MENTENNYPDSREFQPQADPPSAEKSIETEGKTPAEAIEKALDILGVKRNQVKVKIICEEQRGLFGMEGVKPAKVRVTLLKNKKIASR